jgi:hypothetical protein
MVTSALSFGVDPRRGGVSNECGHDAARIDSAVGIGVLLALGEAHDLIASPAFIEMKAADEFKEKTTAPNQLWQPDFTYLKVIGWGWF